MVRLRDDGGAGAISRSWRVRAVTVLAVAAGGTVVGALIGLPVGGFIVGVVLGVGCVVMGEASMDTGAYKFPDKRL